VRVYAIISGWESWSEKEEILRKKVKCGRCNRTILLAKEKRNMIIHKIKNSEMIKVIEIDGEAYILACICDCGASHYIEI
jgi:hypothetical protein